MAKLNKNNVVSKNDQTSPKKLSFYRHKGARMIACGYKTLAVFDDLVKNQTPAFYAQDWYKIAKNNKAEWKLYSDNTLRITYDHFDKVTIDNSEELIVYKIKLITLFDSLDKNLQEDIWVPFNEQMKRLKKEARLNIVLLSNKQ